MTSLADTPIDPRGFHKVSDAEVIPLRALSVFDLDHTLFNCNSSYSFGIYLYQTGKLSLGKALYLAGCYAFHKLGGLSFASLHQRVFQAYFQKIPFSQLEQWVEDFLNRSFEKSFNRIVNEKLIEAKRDKHLIAILSNSPSFLVKKIAQRFQVDHWLATTYCVEEDKIVGISSVILGAHKAQFLETFTKEQGILLSACTAYTDNIADLPLLQIAGKSVAVKPTGRLRKICLQNNWTILE